MELDNVKLFTLVNHSIWAIEGVWWRKDDGDVPSWMSERRNKESRIVIVNSCASDLPLN
ncbi:hypothetical protein [Novosphingobium sp.]|uniref:hypothetical protein n=1 Tax=Novosphingobium sp. TaxID=1874826 RepID=UPI002FDB2AA7